MAKKKRREPQWSAQSAPVPAEVQEALDMAEEIVRIIRDDIPERSKLRALDYFESVETKADSIGKTIASTNRVTEGQLNALTNMTAGVKKWIHEED